jgi:hypothetical protein
MTGDDPFFAVEAAETAFASAVSARWRELMQETEADRGGFAFYPA